MKGHLYSKSRSSKSGLQTFPKTKEVRTAKHTLLCASHHHNTVSNPGELSANGPRQISSYHCSLQHWGFFRSIYVFAQGLKSSPANSPKTQSHVLLTAGEKIASYQRCCMLLPWSVCCDIVWRSSCLSPSLQPKSLATAATLKGQRATAAAEESPLHSSQTGAPRAGHPPGKRSWHHNKTRNHLVNAISIYCNMIPVFTQELHMPERLIQTTQR